MEKEENQNNTTTDQNHNIGKEAEKPKENLEVESKEETVQEKKEDFRNIYSVLRN